MVELQYMEEYIKCCISSQYAIENHLTLFANVEGMDIPFRLTHNQRKMVSSVDRYRFNLIKKGRQLGATQAICAQIAVNIAFKMNDSEDNIDNIFIVTNRLDMSMKMLDKIKKHLLSLPRWVWGPEYYGSPEKEKKSIFTSDSKKELKLAERKSKIKALCNPEGVRGCSPTHVIMDEAAYIDRGEHIYNSCLYGLHGDGKMTLISTPNGNDNLFYPLYQKTIIMETNYHITNLMWYYDVRFNRNLTWDKLNSTNDDFVTYDSIDKFIFNGYKPSSDWYKLMSEGMNNDPNMIKQELDAEFIRYHSINFR